MTKTTWVRNIRYNVKGQQGCCGAAIVYRLAASEVTTSNRQRGIELWRETPNAKMALVGHYSWKKDTILANAKRLEYKPMTTAYANTANGLGKVMWNGGAIPLEMAFVGTLEAMYYNQQAMYFMSDNVAGEGDVELGPYNTRAFALWLGIKQLGTLMTPGPIKSLRTGKNIQGWIFHPNWDMCNALIKETKLDFIAMIEDMNNDERLKGNTHAKLSADAKSATVLTRALDDGWEDFGT